MNNGWWREDWRNNPLIQRSDNPLLKTLAIETMQPYVKRGLELQHALSQWCGILGNHSRIGAAQTITAVGHYLIPGSDTDNGVRCSTRQIGAMIEYDDGRVEWNVFVLEDIYNEAKHGREPVQMRLFA